MKLYWEQLLAGAAPIKLYSQPGEEYNLGNLHDFVIGQAGGAIKTYIEIYGVDRLQSDLKSDVHGLNKKYLKLLNQFGGKE